MIRSNNGLMEHEPGEAWEKGCWCPQCWNQSCAFERAKYEIGDTVRVVNWAGPCLLYEVVKLGKRRIKLDDVKGDRFAPYIECHNVPCERCTDHPQTNYPRGYEG